MSAVKNLVFGIGINDANYKITEREIIEGKKKITWICPFYKTWKSMLCRCYYKAYHSSRPSYSECKTIPEWHYFMAFRAWMETQEWEGKVLDKDLLMPGNKVYGPNTCVFVDAKVNTFVTDSKAARGEWPLGLYFDKPTQKFRAQGHSVETGKRVHLGLFTDAQEAHQAWLSYKLEQAKILASQQTDERVAKALVARYENYKQ